jgi:hypothetical protein
MNLYIMTPDCPQSVLGVQEISFYIIIDCNMKELKQDQFNITQSSITTSLPSKQVFDSNKGQTKNRLKSFSHRKSLFFSTQYCFSGK